MFIPTSSSDLCPAKLASSILTKREWTSDVVSTGKSFEHWDTCMDNRTCKIVALIGICIGGLILIWIVSSIFSCLCCGGSCSRSVFCCCCNCGGSGRKRSAGAVPPTRKNTTTRKGSRFARFGRGNSYEKPPVTPRQYQYEPPSSMSPSYPGYKKETGYGYVRDLDEESMTDTNSVAEYYARNPAPTQNPFSPINHSSDIRNQRGGQNTYF